MDKKIVIAGKNKIAVDGLLYLIEKKINKANLLVCCNANDFGEHTWQPSLKKIAIQYGISIVELNQLYPIENLIFFSLEFDKIINPSKFKSNQLYNIHFSALPAYKGMFTSVWPLINGENSAGVTLHKIDKGIDTGAIIDQRIFELDENVNSFQLYQLFLKNSFQLFIDNFDSLYQNNYKYSEQESFGSTYYSKNTIDFKNLSINFYQTAYQIKNYVRAFSFRPYQLLTIDGNKISHIKITSHKSELKPGTKSNVTEISETRSTIDYDIIIWYNQLDTILKAAEKNDYFQLRNFHNTGYDLNEKNEKGWNAMIIAGYNGHIETVRELVKLGYSIHEMNNNGTNVLMYVMTQASTSDDLSTLKFLVELGADIYHKDFRGISLLEYAQKLNNKNVLHFLESQI
jgi:methionyl-tRNA formyltransferase